MAKHTFTHYAKKSGKIDVELSENGEIAAVWYGTLALPFSVEKVGPMRTENAKRLYIQNNKSKVIEMTVKDACWA